MDYNGITGTVEYNEFDNVWHGKLMHVDDLVTYQADLFEDLHGEFVKAVDDWRETRNAIDKGYCPSCNSDKVSVILGTERYEDFSIYEVESSNCDICNFMYFTPAQARALDQQFKIRKAHGLIDNVMYHLKYIVRNCKK